MTSPPGLVPADTEQNRSVTTRSITFAGSAVTIASQGDQAAALVDFLFGRLPPAVEPLQPIFHLQPGERPGELAIYRNGARLYQGDAPATAERLLGYVSYELADRSQNGLLFHAAALAWQGRGVLLPAPSGAGKSTLAAWLLTRGLTYLTDELVFIPAGSDWLHGFTRPLNLKPPSRTVLALPPALLSAESPVESPLQFLHSPHLDLVSPALLGTLPPLNAAPFHWIVFPQYQAGATLTLQPLSKAQAGKALLECLLNARNLPEHGFFEAARLARRLPAYHLTYGHFDQLDQGLADLFLLSG